MTTVFVRVRDVRTRHQFDVPERDWRIAAGLFKRVNSRRYPPVARPRMPKPYVKVKPARASRKEDQQ